MKFTSYPDFVASDAYRALTEYLDDEYCLEDDIPIESLADVGVLIRDLSIDVKTKKDGDFLVTTYKYTCGGFQFKSKGRAYIKDQSICDEEMEEALIVEKL
jgi:hypothetical protein